MTTTRETTGPRAPALPVEQPTTQSAEGTRRAESDAARRELATDRVESRGPAAGSPERALAARLARLPLQSDATQTQCDVALSGAFPNGEDFLRQLGRLSPSAVERAVRAAGFTGEMAEKILQSLENRVAMAFTQKMIDHIASKFERLERQLSCPTDATIRRFAEELSGPEREACLDGLRNLGMSDKTLAAIREHTPPADDAQRAKLDRLLRSGLPECARAVREERERVIGGAGGLSEWSTGELTATYPNAAQEVAATLGINREAVRTDGVAFGRAPTFTERSLMNHAEDAETRRVGGDIARYVLQRAGAFAFTVVTGGAGMAATVVGTGIGAAEGARDIGQADRVATRTEAAFRAGMTSDAAARRASRAARQARVDASVAVVSGMATGVASEHGGAAARQVGDALGVPASLADGAIPAADRRGGRRQAVVGGER